MLARNFFGSALVAFVLAACAVPRAQEQRPPNFVVIFVDDLGYGDIGPFGSKKNRTPVLDQMAKEGTLLTSFYAAPVCTPSRAALMTGCYPKRVGLHQGSWHGVLMPGDTNGLHPDEVTIAEVLKTKGYTTACIGKWPLGDQPQFLPTRQGFDEFFGVPYSNDMFPARRSKNRNFPPLPLMRGEKVLREAADQSLLTGEYTREAVAFIERNKERPFFLYLPHTMVHVPLHAGANFKDKSENGILGDAIEEIDWSTGEILKTLKRLGLDENTLVLFTSDNGAARGSSGPLRAKKGSTFEGGVRVPCIVRWPGHVPAGKTSDEITSTMDLLPSFAGLAGAALPKGRKLDGGDIVPLLLGTEGARSPTDLFYYYRRNRLMAVRSGLWKLHVPQRPNGVRRLFHLGRDIGEKDNVVAKHPKVVDRLSKLMQAARLDLGDGGTKGAGCRPVGVAKSPRTLMPRKDGSRAPVRGTPRLRAPGRRKKSAKAGRVDAGRKR